MDGHMTMLAIQMHGKLIDKQFMKKKPKISVIMPVYNAEPYLSQAVDSILNQTYRNFEFIIIDDVSTDGSWEILNEYAKKNKKIKLFRNSKNYGISVTAKRAILKTKGDFIARMDADDIALPFRLEKQIFYLRKHKKTVAVGGNCILIDRTGTVIGEKTFPSKFNEIYRYIFKFFPLQEPTLMIAKKRLPKNFQYYIDGMNIAEEVELIFKLFLHGKVENLKDYVLMYRLHQSNTSLIDVRKTFIMTLYARVKAVIKYGYKPSLAGIITTIMQAFVVLFLPKNIVLSIYSKTRGIQYKSKYIATDQNLNSLLSLQSSQ